MKVRWLVLLLALAVPGTAGADAPKKATVTGATWGSINGEKHNPVRTHAVETDGQGRITRLYDVKKPDAGISAAYEGDRCRFSFTQSIVAITVELSWVPQDDGSFLVRYAQQNDVPEQKVAGTTYPAHTLQKAFSLLLKTDGAGGYSWAEKRETSWLEEDGRSAYVCTPGNQAVHTQFDENGQPECRWLLDGVSSDSSPETTAKMFYHKNKNSVVGTYYWTYEPMAWDLASWEKGGRIEYRGDALSAADPLVNVVNYYILGSWFGQNAWNYFGPSLFGIPVR